MAKSDKIYHIISRGKGWALKREGARKAASVFNTKSKAIKISKRYQEQNHDVVIHTRDGTVSEWRKGK